MLLAGNLNFKLRIVFWNIFFWRFGDLKKRITLSEKKPPLQLGEKYVKVRTPILCLVMLQLTCIPRFLKLKVKLSLNAQPENLNLKWTLFTGYWSCT